MWYNERGTLLDQCGIWNQTNLGSNAKCVTLDKLLNLPEPVSTFVK